MPSERVLLERGRSYAEIATLLGISETGLAKRNRLRYHVDLFEAFRRRIQREGLPKRLVPREHGWYFAGFFDGEGSFLLWTRDRPGRIERRLGVQIGLRADDEGVLQLFQTWFGGNLGRYKGSGSSRPSTQWKIESLKVLAEVIVPLFDTYGLRTKKAQEFLLWRDLVLRRYVATLGGTVRHPSWEAADIQAFHEAEQTVQALRNP